MITQIPVSRLEVGVQSMMTDFPFANPVRVEQDRDESPRMMMYVLTTSIAAGMPQTVSVWGSAQVPASWWEHWKRDALAPRVWPKWRGRLLSGVRHERVSIVGTDTYKSRTCPHLTLPAGDKSHVLFLGGLDVEPK